MIAYGVEGQAISDTSLLGMQFSLFWPILQCTVQHSLSLLICGVCFLFFKAVWKEDLGEGFIFMKVQGIT